MVRETVWLNLVTLIVPEGAKEKCCVHGEPKSAQVPFFTLHFPGIIQVKLPPSPQGGGSLPQAALSQGSFQELS